MYYLFLFCSWICNNAVAVLFAVEVVAVVVFKVIVLAAGLYVVEFVVVVAVLFVAWFGVVVILAIVLFSVM